MKAHWTNFLGSLVLGIILFSNINLGGKIPKLTCPSHRRLLLKETQKCYYYDAKGPCPEEMVVRPSDEDRSIGVCKCDIKEFCHGTRPKIFLHEYARCFSFFDQGPCEEGEWLVPCEDKDGCSAKCQVIPCPERYKKQYVNYTGSGKQSSSGYFISAYEGKCYNKYELHDKLCRTDQSTSYFATQEGKFELICVSGLGSSCGSTLATYNDCEGGTKPDVHGGCEPNVEFE